MSEIEVTESISNSNVASPTTESSLNLEIQQSTAEEDTAPVIVTTDCEGNVQNVTDDGSGEPAAKKIRVVSPSGEILVYEVSENLDDTQSEDTITPAEEFTPLTEPVESSHDELHKTDVTQAWFTRKMEKNALQDTGHSWKQGQWSKEEVGLLQNNIVHYCKEHRISDPTEIIFEMSKDERKDFYRCVARGLQRPLFSVYRRVIRMYDQKNHMGKYTTEEIDKLKELRIKHGSDWATIGAALGRSASSVKDRCRLMKETCNSGKWLPEEESRLTAAVYELSNVHPGEPVTHGLSWAAVADKVVTRSEKQCRSKWLNYLNWKQTGGSEWTRQDDMNLVLKITESGITDETQLDWDLLAKNWPSVRSPQWLRGKWWSVKRHVPDCHMLSFTDIVKFLSDYHAQNIRPKSQPLRLTHLPRVSVMSAPGLTLQVPVAVASGGNTISTTTQLDEDDGTFQTYELIQHVPTSGTYLITQPQSNPAITFSGSMATDHIIVHTLPLVQGGSYPGNENVTVQSVSDAAMQHVVVNTNVESTGENGRLHLQETTEIPIQSGNNTREIITTTEATYEEVEGTSEADIVDESNNLVINTSPETSEPITRPTESRELIMSSLSDPMLASEMQDSDLCEVETEKPQQTEEN